MSISWQQATTTHWLPVVPGKTVTTANIGTGCIGSIHCRRRRRRWSWWCQTLSAKRWSFETSVPTDIRRFLAPARKAAASWCLPMLNQVAIGDHSQDFVALKLGCADPVSSAIDKSAITWRSRGAERAAAGAGADQGRQVRRLNDNPREFAVGHAGPALMERLPRALSRRHDGFFACSVAGAKAYREV